MACNGNRSRLSVQCSNRKAFPRTSRDEPAPDQASRALYEPFQHVTALLQRPRPEITATGVEDVKGDIDRPRRCYIRPRLTKQIEARHQPFVEYRDLAIEYEGHTRQRRHGFDQVRKAGSMLDALPTDKAHVASSLVCDEAPAVDLFLIDPSGAVEGLDERRLKRTDGKGGIASHRVPFCRMRQAPIRP
jgi:hypothetical protein